MPDSVSAAALARGGDWIETALADVEGGADEEEKQLGLRLKVIAEMRCDFS